MEIENKVLKIVGKRVFKTIKYHAVKDKCVVFNIFEILKDGRTVRAGSKVERVYLIDCGDILKGENIYRLLELPHENFKFSNSKERHPFSEHAMIEVRVKDFDFF